MKNTSDFRRNLAAVALLFTAVLSLVSAVLAPAFPAEAVDRLAEIEAGGTAAAVSAFTFVLAQLPFLVAVLGLGHLLRGRAPVLANLGPSLAVLGAFGHSVVGGAMLMNLEMASDEANRSVHGALLADFESSPAALFFAFGLIGTVLGLVLLAIGLWRAKVGPRWVPPAIAAFILIEFIGAGFSEWASLVASVVYVITFGALAVFVARTPLSDWQAPAAAPGLDRESLPA